jgi:putative transposase
MKAPKQRRPIQQELRFRTHGGRRERAPTAIVHQRRGAPHRARPLHDKSRPVHVTMRRARRLPSLRKQTLFLAIRRALPKTAREWFRVVHFSVQADHIHMVVEGDDKVSLSRGLAGLSIRLARAINRVAGRRGQVFSERYHARALGSPREVRHCLVYVLLNFRKHLNRPAGVDPASSGFWFHGWKARASGRPPGWDDDEPVPVQPARTWLARKGWERHGLIDLSERPKPEAAHLEPLPAGRDH